MSSSRSSSRTNDVDDAVADEVGARFARARALAVLRVRGRALGVALLPAASAVVLLVAAGTGRLEGQGWDVVRWAVSGLAVAVLLLAAAVAAVVARAKPALSPTVTVPEKSAPDLYRLVGELAERLGVPRPSAIALTPDCDSWLEDRTHRSHAPPASSSGRGGDTGGAVGERRQGLARLVARLTGRGGRDGLRQEPAAPVLVVGSPFLWWMRIAELRAVLAPVVAGTGSAAHPDIAAARRFVRGLDAAVAVASRPGLGPVRRVALAPIGRIARLLLRACGEHAALMERGVAAAASERAQAVDYGLRIVAQEQVGLAYAGWDRLLTRVALPAWRMGRWPARLDAGVVSALTELSRRDRLAEGFTSRLGERPACDLLEEPGTMDEAASLLAARLFHGGPAEGGPDWSPVDWQQYPDEVVDRKWRTEAARLHRVLDEMGVRQTGSRQGPAGPTLSRVLDHLSRRPSGGGRDQAAPDAAYAFSHAAGASLLARSGPPAAIAAAGPERVSGQYRGAGADGPRRREAEAISDPYAMLGDPADDTLPVVPRGLETLDAPDAPSTDGPAPQAAYPYGAAREATPPHHEPPETTTPGEPAAKPSPRQGSAPHAGVQPSTQQYPSTTHAPSTTQDPTADDGTADDPPPYELSPSPSPDAREHAETGRDDGTSAGRSCSGAVAGAPGATGVSSDADSPADALAACISAELAREAAASQSEAPGPGARSARATDSLPLVPLQPPRSGRDLLADHVTAMVCCSAVDTAGAHPGLDWLDGPTLLVGGERHADLSGPVHSLVEDGDPGPLRTWLASLGVRPEKPVRLV